MTEPERIRVVVLSGSTESEAKFAVPRPWNVCLN